MKSELTKLAEAQEKISKINDEIFERELKLEDLKKIKDNKQLFIREFCESDSFSRYGLNDFGTRSQRIIKSIKIYNYRNTKYTETVSVDITRYFVSTFSNVTDFLRRTEYMIVNEGDPLWVILITNYMKKLNEANEADKAQIEEIKNGLINKGEE